ncbi:glycosyltransferase family 4 protein, partial [Paenibacillus phytohabitans]
DYISATYLPYPNVATLRNYPYADYVMTYGKIKGWIMAKVHLNILQKLSAPVACSDSIARMVGEHGIKLYSVKNGVDTDRFFPATPEEKELIKNELNLPKDKKVYVSVGHLSTRKDPLFVIKGFLKSKLKENGYLVMVGDGPLRSECEQLVENEDSVHILGRTDRVNDYLRGADFCISASKAEGLPNSILEALATGLPAVLSDIEPHKEMLELNTKAGLLFVLGDESEFVNKLNQILDLNQDEMKQAALDIIEYHLSAKKMSENYMEIYNKIVN